MYSIFRSSLKSAFFLSLGMLVLGGCAHIAKERASDVQWQVFSEEKIEDALATDKPVLVVVTAEWCSSCNWMKSTTFADQTIIDALNKDFVVFALDVDQAPKSAERFLKNGIPSTYYLQKDGSVKNTIVAYRDANDYGSFLKASLNRNDEDAAVPTQQNALGEAAVSKADAL